MAGEELSIASTTDCQAGVVAAAENDAKNSRTGINWVQESTSQDGSSVVSSEHVRSERTLLLERLEQEADRDEEELQELTATSSTDLPELAGEGAASTDGEFTEGESKSAEAVEPAPAAALLPADHPHLKRQRELMEHYGPEEYARLTMPGQQALNAGYDLSPGVARMIADMPNSEEMLMELMAHPNAATVITRLNSMSPSTAHATLTQVSRDISARNTTAAGGPTRPRSSAPPPINPVRGSSTKSALAPDEMSYQDFRKWRDGQQKSRYQR